MSSFKGTALSERAYIFLWCLKKKKLICLRRGVHTVEEELFTAISMKLLSFASFSSETNLNPLEDSDYYVHHLHSETVSSTKCQSINAFRMIVTAKKKFTWTKLRVGKRNVDASCSLWGRNWIFNISCRKILKYRSNAYPSKISVVDL